MHNGQAFIFGRSDWEYVYNTFCFGYNMGYDFIRTATGACNGNFLGIGADDCWTAVNVEEAEDYGLLITNGEFTAFEGPDPTPLCAWSEESRCAVSPPVLISGHNRTADIAGTGVVGFGDCTFASWDRLEGPRTDAQIRATGGTVMVRGCSFLIDRPQVDLEPGVEKAIITDNTVRGKVGILNHCTGQVVNRDNLGGAPSTQP